MKKVLFTFLLLLSVVGFALAQNKVVKGVVIGKSDNLPVIGAAVVVDGNASMGVATNFDGKFELTVPSSAKNLKISYLGYKDKIVPISTTNMTIYLEPDAKELDAVMVVAYGTQSKNSFTGSASKVDLSNVQSKATSNLSSALEGVAPGVQVFSTGQPGTSSTVQIRGIGSLNSNTAPLYVVDGVPLGASLNSIDPADIESMTVLKDASATALYGARAANGVILITTRKGALGKVNIEANIRAGYNLRLIPMYDVIDSPEQYMELSYQALKNLYEIPMGGSENSYGERLKKDYESKGKPVPSVSDLLFVDKGGDGIYKGQYSIPTRYSRMWILTDEDVKQASPYIDPATGKFRTNLKRRYFDKWEDEIFRTGQNYQADMKISGGSDRTRFYTSMGFQKNIGYYIGSDFSRFNIRNNITTEVIKNMNLSSNIAYSRTEMNAPGQTTAFNNGFNYVNNAPPIYPVFEYDKDGKLVEDKTVPGRYRYDYGDKTKRPFGNGINPAGSVALDINRIKKHTVLSNFSLDYRFLNDFKFAINYGLQVEYSDQRETQNPYYGDAANVSGRIYASKNINTVQTLNQILSWNRKFGSHTFDVFVAHESSDTYNRYDNFAKSIMLKSDITNMNFALKMENIKGYDSKTALESYFGQLRYEYDNRYFVSASLRRDGSSKFAPDHRWGTFGSVGLAWMINNEQFMNSYNWLDNLKFKASYGVLGNQGINLGYSIDGPDLYPYYDMYEYLNVDDSPSISRIYLGNPNLTWERSATFNIGLEGSIYSGAFTWDVEYFVKNSDNMLFRKQVAPSLGYSFFPSNDGAIINHGLEFNLGSRLVNTKLVKFDININGGFYRNSITRMAKDANGNVKHFEQAGNYIRKKGHSVFDYYLREYRGVDKETGYPLWSAKYKTEEKDGKVVPIYKKVIVNGAETNVLDYITDYEDYLAKGGDAKILADTTTNDYNSAIKTIVGKSAIPDLVGGFGWTLTVGDVSWSTQFSYGIGGYGYDNTYAGLMNSNARIGSFGFHKDMLNAWTPQNTKTDIPMMTANGDPKFIEYANSTSTRFLTSRSYLNLSNTRISYNVPKDWLKKIGIASASVFVSGDNLFVLTARKGYVSMTSDSGNTSSYRYLPLSTISVGAQVKF